MLEYYAAVLAFVTALCSSWLFTKWIIPNALTHNLTGRDVHKVNRVFIAEMGGIAIALSFLLGISVFIGVCTILQVHNLNFGLLLAAVASALIIFIIGMIDDLFEMRWGIKSILPIIGALPLIAVMAGSSAMIIPLIGVFDFTWMYYFIIIPLGITGAANAMNMVAGYNGLEAGLGIIILLTMAIMSMITGSVLSFALCMVMIGALAGFIYFNWYPAKIFMGDAGTLQIGAVIASVAILGGFEFYAVLLFTLYFINLVIFMLGVVLKAKRVRFAHPDKDGKLVPPVAFWKFYLPFFLLKKIPMTERQLVRTLLLFQIIVSIFVLLLYLMELLL